MVQPKWMSENLATFVENVAVVELQIPTVLKTSQCPYLFRVVNAYEDGFHVNSYQNNVGV